MNSVITCANSITALGHNGQAGAASYFAGITRIQYDSSFGDSSGNPVKTARIEGLFGDQPDEARFMARVAEHCLADLCSLYFENKETPGQLFLFLGLPAQERPGLNLYMDHDSIRHLEEVVKPFAGTVISETFKTGNASAVSGMLLSREVLQENPDAVCIVGGVDSLLAPDTLAWFEKDRRLKSDSDDREQSLVPSHGVGFFVMESVKGAGSRKRSILASVKGVSKATEPAPFVSDEPCKALGLTRAIRAALTQQATRPSDIDTIFCDLNGEYYRAREWGMASLRCFEKGNPETQLFHPADCMGSLGAASLPVLINFAVERFKKEGSEKTVCLFASDDFGERGALILEKIETV